jgi:hypothetical protein
MSHMFEAYLHFFCILLNLLFIWLVRLAERGVRLNFLRLFVLFHRGHGLGVLGFGKNVPVEVRALFEERDDPSLATSTRTTFASTSALRSKLG